MKEKEAQLAEEVEELLNRAEEVDDTARTSVEMSCRRSWPFVKDGWRRYGRLWRRWKPRRRRLQNRPRPRVVSMPEDRSQRN